MVEALDTMVRNGMLKAEDLTKESIAGFLSGFGRRFYKLGEERERIRMRRGGQVVAGRIGGNVVCKENEVVCWRAGRPTWGIEWI